jgi:hypothetical protein
MVIFLFHRVSLGLQRKCGIWGVWGVLWGQASQYAASVGGYSFLLAACSDGGRSTIASRREELPSTKKLRGSRAFSAQFAAMFAELE